MVGERAIAESAARRYTRMPHDSMTMRDEFAEFLERLSCGPIGAIEWNRFVVAHYPDAVMETIRVNVVRLMMCKSQCSYTFTEAERDQLQYWSQILKDRAAAEQYLAAITEHAPASTSPKIAGERR